MGGALVRPALPDAGGGGIVTRTAPTAHGLHRARGRVRRAGCAVVPVRLRAGSSDELAARRAALLACDAKRRRDGDSASVGLAQEGLRLALLVEKRPYSVVLRAEILRVAMVATKVADELSGQAGAKECGRPSASVRRSEELGLPRVRCPGGQGRESLHRLRSGRRGMATTLEGSGFCVVFGSKSTGRRGLPRFGTQAAAAPEGGGSND